MSKQGDPYKPIQCGLHSEYELAIMHQLNLQLSWLDQQDTEHHEKVRPLDLKTKDHQEYLVVKSKKGVHHEIRLDKILQSDVSEAIKA